MSQLRESCYKHQTVQTTVLIMNPTEKKIVELLTITKSLLYNKQMIFFPIGNLKLPGKLKQKIKN